MNKNNKRQKGENKYKEETWEKNYFIRNACHYFNYFNILVRLISNGEKQKEIYKITIKSDIVYNLLISAIDFESEMKLEFK